MVYNNFQIGLYEIFHADIHGFNINGSDPKIYEKLLTHCTFSPREFYNNECEETIQDIEYIYDEIYRTSIIEHPTIRNYSNIINNAKYLKLEILKLEILPTQECVCVIKTFWLKIIQRKWKKIYKERMILLIKLKNYRNLLKRELNGKYPNGLGLRNFPEFKLNLNN